MEIPTPFGDPVAEVPLSNAPLIAVIAQVRFPPVASIVREDFVGPFQERIREAYPVLRQEREVNLVLTPRGVQAGSDSAPVWRFLDRDENPEWKVSLASSFVALDASSYTSHMDFLSKLRAVLAALAETVRPAVCDRLGVRYVDRVVLDDTDVSLGSLLRPEVLGVATVELGADAALTHSISDSEFRLDDAVLHARWGQLPPNAQVDPFHGDAVDHPSWILDLDMSDTHLGAFDVDAMTSRAGTFAERIYRFFRWAVRPELLRRYGGEV